MERRRVAGRYDLLAVRGRGGMGVVWEADDSLLGRRVAVKEIDVRAGDRGTRDRALREARAAARVSHRNLVTIYDAVEEDGQLFLVQEFIDAPTLKQVVHGNGPLAPSQVAAVGLELAAALEVVHDAGVIHRDVKPSNVMLLTAGAVKLGDFGVARITGDPDLTATGVVIGSPAYLAPEQARGDTVTPAVDWWSLGATLFFASEGRPPFDGPTMTVLSRLAVGEVPELARAGALAPALEELFRTDPDERATGPRLRALLSDLARSAPDEAATQMSRESRADAVGVVASEVTEPAIDPSAPATTQLPPVAPAGLRTDGRGLPGDSQRPRRGRFVLPGLPVIAAAVITLLLIVAAIALAGGGGAPSSVDEAPQAAAAQVQSRQFEEWADYRDERTGYVVRYPESWDVRARDDTRTDFVDPETGAYLRVDWTDEPGASPEGAWEELSRGFAERYRSYEEISIESTEFKGLDAALWEYRYEAGGVELHAYNLGMVNAHYGFALNFQAPEDEWASYLETWELLKAGFEPAVDDKSDQDDDKAEDDGKEDDEKHEDDEKGGNGNGGKGKGDD